MTSMGTSKRQKSRVAAGKQTSGVKVESSVWYEKMLKNPGLNLQKTIDRLGGFEIQANWPVPYLGVKSEDVLGEIAENSTLVIEANKIRNCTIYAGPKDDVILPEYYRDRILGDYILFSHSQLSQAKEYGMDTMSFIWDAKQTTFSAMEAWNILCQREREEILAVPLDQLGLEINRKIRYEENFKFAEQRFFAHHQCSICRPVSVAGNILKGKIERLQVIFPLDGFPLQAAIIGEGRKELVFLD